MLFNVKVAYNMEMVKIAKLTKIYGGNLKSRKRLATALHLTHEMYSRLTVKLSLCGGLKNNKTYQKFRYYCDSEKLTLTTLKKAVANIWENSRKTSITSSTVHETALPKHYLMCG